jgi:hypothetical protein
MSHGLRGNIFPVNQDLHAHAVDLCCQSWRGENRRIGDVGGGRCDVIERAPPPNSHSVIRRI